MADIISAELVQQQSSVKVYGHACSDTSINDRLDEMVGNEVTTNLTFVAAHDLLIAEGYEKVESIAVGNYLHHRYKKEVVDEFRSRRNRL